MHCKEITVAAMIHSQTIRDVSKFSLYCSVPLVVIGPAGSRAKVCCSGLTDPNFGKHDLICLLRHLLRMRIRISAMPIENGSFCCMAKRSSQKRPQDCAETYNTEWYLIYTWYDSQVYYKSCCEAMFVLRWSSSSLVPRPFCISFPRRVWEPN